MMINENYYKKIINKTNNKQKLLTLKKFFSNNTKDAIIKDCCNWKSLIDYTHYSINKIE